MSTTRIGIDVGGTFTDGVMVRDGEIGVAKVRSRPDDIAAAILDCVAALGADLRDVDLFIHGSTVATNAVVQKQASSVAHITTAGHRDILFIRRGDSLAWNVRWDPPAPIVARRDIFEVRERLAYDGSVVEPFDVEGAERVAQIVAERGYRAVSVTFLHAYANAEHEQRMAEILARVAPDTTVCLSSDILPHYREFERSSTTAVNAFLVPLVSEYLDRLDAGVRAAGFERPLLIMQSNGGLCTTDEAKRVPARLVRSGPAGGAVATLAQAEQLGISEAIFLDMGGTSTEVAVLHKGQVRSTPELEFSWGLPIRFPSVDIHSIGAGGGSIAYVEGGRYLKVGPRSAGASPGPACYGQGGEEPTTTDAQVVLGRVDAREGLLGGRMELRRDLAERAIHDHIAQPLGLTLEQAALGILDVTTNNTVQAVRLMTVRRGLDPRGSCLLASGGGGPLYAAAVADALRLERAVVSPWSGVACALGMVLADFRYDTSATLLRRSDELDPETVEETFAGFEEAIGGLLDDAGVPADARTIERILELRYDGQGYELPVAVEDRFDAAAMKRARTAFDGVHQTEFNWHDPARALEVAFARAVATGRIPGKPELTPAPHANGRPPAVRGARECWFSGLDGPVATAVIPRETVEAGEVVHGPAIFEQMDTTTLVPPGWTATADERLNLVLTPGGAR